MTPCGPPPSRVETQEPNESRLAVGVENQLSQTRARNGDTVVGWTHLDRPEKKNSESNCYTWPTGRQRLAVGRGRPGRVYGRGLRRR